jgi:hypothetical protein
VAGVDGSKYYVTGPGGKGVYMVGEREDDDEPRGPWSDAAWAVELTFEIDAHGSGTGPHEIRVTTTGEGDRTVGVVHLGDDSNAEGISVGGPTTTVYLAKALTLDVKWRAKFDSRSGKMRGKMWPLSEPEPAAWDVETPMEETDDDQDRWELWLRADTSQTIKVWRIRAQQDADDGKKVD